MVYMTQLSLEFFISLTEHGYCFGQYFCAFSSNQIHDYHIVCEGLMVVRVKARMDDLSITMLLADDHCFLFDSNVIADCQSF